jgi:hypothetical protein
MWNVFFLILLVQLPKPQSRPSRSSRSHGLGNETETGTFLDVSEIGTRRMARTTFTRNPRAAEKWRENHGAYTTLQFLISLQNT